MLALAAHVTDHFWNDYLKGKHYNSSENRATRTAWVAKDHLATELKCEYKFSRQARKGGIFQGLECRKMKMSWSS